jgi:hypothetical protein
LVVALMAQFLTAPAAEGAAPRTAPIRSRSIISENQLPGTAAWRITPGSKASIEGFADHVSAQQGDTVKLYVSTKARKFHVEAYRMGYYQGLGSRLIWTSPSISGGLQAAPTVDSLQMVETHWNSSLSFTVGTNWVPGVYLLKIVGSNGAENYIQLCIRDDSSHAALVMQLSVATWQAYNKWGGYSLYVGPGKDFANRARTVSFDRPYKGRTGQLLKDLPFISLAEKLGLDVTYWTDLDLHERPNLLKNHKGLITLSHDEYWSTSMRDGALAARAAGVNIAFLGANAIFRHIRVGDSPLGTDRHIIDYKSAAEDPLNGIDDAEVTVNWRDPPVNWPESQLLGALYQCNPAHGDVTVSDASSFVFAGTGVHNGDTIPDAVDLEYDAIDPAMPTPKSIESLAHSPITCVGFPETADMTYYTATSKAGVFDAASQGWVQKVKCFAPVSAASCSPVAQKVTENIMTKFAAGPAGATDPSAPNLAALGITLLDPTDP